MTVIGARRLAPRLQRLRLAGQDLGRFDVLTNLHIRPYVPARADMGNKHPLPSPVLDKNGRPGLMDHHRTMSHATTRSAGSM